jgi:hypothetical protein
VERGRKGELPPLDYKSGYVPVKEQEGKFSDKLVTVAINSSNFKNSSLKGCVRDDHCSKNKYQNVFAHNTPS